MNYPCALRNPRMSLIEQHIIERGNYVRNRRLVNTLLNIALPLTRYLLIGTRYLSRVTYLSVRVTSHALPTYRYALPLTRYSRSPLRSVVVPDHPIKIFRQTKSLVDINKASYPEFSREKVLQTPMKQPTRDFRLQKVRHHTLWFGSC